MLSYMREDNENDTTLANNREMNEKDRAPCRPADDERDYLVPANTGKHASRSTKVLLVLFFTGLVLLIFMVKRVTPLVAEAAMSEDSMQIERAVANLTGIRQEMDGNLNDAIRSISTLSDIKQVRVDELRKNPFQHASARQITGRKVNKSQGSTMHGARKKADELHLWTIVSSEKKRSCMINDKILYEGDSILGLRVNLIDEDFVELVGRRSRIILRMSQ
jgi:hypothetical protein